MGHGHKGLIRGRTDLGRGSQLGFHARRVFVEFGDARRREEAFSRID
ncbi:MAG: hypothetical protein ABSF25_04005 [Bryobacteraceae bacterium]